MQSNSMSQEPQNLKQIRNRQSAIRKSLLQNIYETIPQQDNDHLHTLLRAQRDSVSFFKTVTVIDQSYIAYLTIWYRKISLQIDGGRDIRSWHDIQPIWFMDHRYFL